MRVALLALAAAVFSAGCSTDEGTPDPEGVPSVVPTLTTPAPATGTSEVYRATIAFSVQTQGEQPLDVPAGARTITLEAEFRSDAPVSSVADIRLAIEDANGDVVLECAQGAAVSGSPPNCSPKTTGLEGFSAPFVLVWSGNGNVEADVVVSVAV